MGLFNIFKKKEVTNSVKPLNLNKCDSEKPVFEEATVAEDLNDSLFDDSLPEDMADSLLNKYKFDFDSIPKSEIRSLIEEAINDYPAEDSEYIRVLCGYLFCIGDSSDANLIDKAKHGINFDVECMIDGEWIDSLRNGDTDSRRESIINDFKSYYKSSIK